MKKVFALAFALLLLLCNAGCGKANQAFPVLIQSNGTRIPAYKHFLWSESFSEYGWLCADGASLSSALPTVCQEIPAVTYSADFQIHCSRQVTQSSLSVYNCDFNPIHRNLGQIDFDSLSKGEYYLVVSVNVQGNYIKSQKKFESAGYECVCKLIISE